MGVRCVRASSETCGVAASRKALGCATYALGCHVLRRQTNRCRPPRNAPTDAALETADRPAHPHARRCRIRRLRSGSRTARAGIPKHLRPRSAGTHGGRLDRPDGRGAAGCLRLPGTGFAIPAPIRWSAPYLAEPPPFSSAWHGSVFMQRREGPMRFLKNHQTALRVPDRSIQCRRSS